MVEIPVTERLRRVALILWAVVGGILLVASVVWFAGRVRIIWLPLVFAGGIVILLNPLIRMFQRLRFPRVVATIASYLVAASLLVAVGSMLVPAIRNQFQDFSGQLPVLYDEAVTWILNLGETLGVDFGPVWTSDAINDWLQDPANQDAMQTFLGGFGAGAGRVLRGVAEMVAVVFLAPVLAFYFLLDLPRTQRLALELTPPRLREETAFVGEQVGRALTGFVRGQLLVALVVGTLSSIALALIDLPFWLLIGLTAGLLNMVPFIGPFVGGALAGTVGLVIGEPAKALIAIVAFWAIQQLDNQLITPLIQRTRVRLAPPVIVLSLLIGGSIAGLLGVLVAVPLVSVIRIIAGHMWRTRVLGESWEEASEAMIEVVEASERVEAMRRKASTDQTRLFDTMEMNAQAIAEGAEPEHEPSDV